MIRIESIDHIVLRTTRVDEMVDFYCRVLGCTLERVLSAEIGLSQLRAGDALIDIVAVNSELGRAGGEAPSPSGNNLDHFCLQIEPFEERELLDYLSAQGLETGNFEGAFRGPRPAQRLLVTVAVKQRSTAMIRPGCRSDVTQCRFINDEFLEGDRVLGDQLYPGIVRN